MTDSRIEIIYPLIRVPGKALGRNINWDPRSKTHRVQRRTAAPASKFYVPTNTMALDQGDLGACVGYSTAQCLNSEPFGMRLTDVEAKELYHVATEKDEFGGVWPDDDTGSSSLGGMKAAKELGYITSYTHCFNLDDVIHGLQHGPGIAGINWYESFDYPDESTGIVTPFGDIRGGHEVTVQGCDLEEGLIWFRTSWGKFGRTIQSCTGMFCMRLNVAQAMLFTDGDAAFPQK
jgi:hypothetical protein